MVFLARPKKNLFPPTKRADGYPKDKGLYMGSCNRSACLKAGADWYNHGSNAYYCAECARELNEDRFNKKEAQEMFGHTLCTKGKHHG